MKYFTSEFDAKYIDPYLNNSNSTRNSSVRININIPLPILIKQMLEEIFGKPDSTNNVTEHQSNDENKNCEVDTSVQIVQDASISSNNEPNDCSSLHESVSNSTKHKNDKLITIEEEDPNSFHNLGSIEYTGAYLSRLLKSNDERVDRIKNDYLLQSQSDTEISSSQNDTDISTKDSSIFQQCNDNRNESVISVNTNHSFNDADDSSNNDNTAEFLNILQKKNSPETKEVFCESQSSLKEDRTEFSIDASLVNIDHSVQNDTPLFISTLNLRERTPSSFKKNNKLFKTPCYNTALTKQQVHYRSGFYVKVKKTGKTSNSSTINPYGAKPLKSRNIPKQRRMVRPQIVFTPATPKSIS